MMFTKSFVAFHWPETDKGTSQCWKLYSGLHLSSETEMTAISDRLFIVWMDYALEIYIR